MYSLINDAISLYVKQKNPKYIHCSLEMLKLEIMESYTFVFLNI